MTICHASKIPVTPLTTAGDKIARVCKFIQLALKRVTAATILQPQNEGTDLNFADPEE